MGTQDNASGNPHLIPSSIAANIRVAVYLDPTHHHISMSVTVTSTIKTAGGIGGILACTYATGPVLYHHADLMGNVILASTSDVSVAGIQHYTPFGRLASHLGPDLPRFLFSSKESDGETEQIYYGYRYYLANVGNWLTRDPSGEMSGVNLLRFAFNSPIYFIDYLGLWNDGTHGRLDLAHNDGTMGHSDFPGHEMFDYTREDYGISSPFFPPSTWRHFRSLDSTDKELKRDVETCNKEQFERHAHQMQDFFSHYGQGYRWYRGGHVLSTLLRERARRFHQVAAVPDNSLDYVDAYHAAWERTQTWVEQWKGCCCRLDSGKWIRDNRPCNVEIPENKWGINDPPPTPRQFPKAKTSLDDLNEPVIW